MKNKTTALRAKREKLLETNYQVLLTQETREELNTMCNLSEGIVDRVTEQVTRDVTKSVTKSVTESVTKSVTKEVGMKKDIESVQNLMRTTGWSIDKVLDALMIPEAMRLPIRKALAN